MEEKKVSKQKNDACLACQIITVGSLFGIGCYMFKLGLQNKSKFTYYVLGTAFMGLSAGELFDVSPFRSKTQ